MNTKIKDNSSGLPSSDQKNIEKYKNKHKENRSMSKTDVQSQNLPIQRTQINLKSDLQTDRQKSTSAKGSRENSPMINFEKYKKSSGLDSAKSKGIVHGHTISSQSNLSNISQLGHTRGTTPQIPPNSSTVMSYLFVFLN